MHSRDRLVVLLVVGANVVTAGPAWAQALLERVLSQIDSTEVTGIFANSADNIPVIEIIRTRTETTEVISTDTLPLTLQAFLDGADTGVDPARVYIGDGPGAVTLQQYLTSGTLPSYRYYGFTGAPPADARVVGADVPDGAGGFRRIYILADRLGNDRLDSVAVSLIAAAEGLTLTFTDFDGRSPSDYTVTTTTFVDTEVSFTDLFAGRINASVTNVLSGLDGPTAATSTTGATEAVNAIIGNISTTGLGAVNTGDITLIGSTQEITNDIDRATAGTSEAIRQTIDHTITQVGTTAGQTVVTINSALNETDVNASVLNAMTGVSTTIGRSGFEIALSDTNVTAVAGMDADAIGALTGGIRTTALGAVNTATIISGANDTVTGVVTSIVGNAAVN
jgi:hypothetical protein